MIVFAFALAATSLPPAVTRFIERRQGCDHWRGEYSEDPVRRRQIEAGAKKECAGSDRELDRLRRLYRRNPAVRDALKDYEKVET
jgi:hypothetical protein